MSHDNPYSHIVRNETTANSNHQYIGEWQVPDTQHPVTKSPKPKPTSPKPEIYY